MPARACGLVGAEGGGVRVWEGQGVGGVCVWV